MKRRPQVYVNILLLNACMKPSTSTATVKKNIKNLNNYSSRVLSATCQPLEEHKTIFTSKDSSAPKGSTS